MEQDALSETNIGETITVAGVVHDYPEKNHLRLRIPQDNGRYRYLLVDRTAIGDPCPRNAEIEATGELDSRLDGPKTDRRLELVLHATDIDVLFDPAQD